MSTSNNERKKTQDGQQHRTQDGVLEFHGSATSCRHTNHHHKHLDTAVEENSEILALAKWVHLQINEVIAGIIHNCDSVIQIKTMNSNETNMLIINNTCK